MRRPFRCVSCNHRLWASVSAEESRDTIPFEQLTNSMQINLPALDASVNRPSTADKT